MFRVDIVYFFVLYIVESEYNSVTLTSCARDTNNPLHFFECRKYRTSTFTAFFRTRTKEAKNYQPAKMPSKGTKAKAKASALPRPKKVVPEPAKAQDNPPGVSKDNPEASTKKPAARSASQGTSEISGV